MGCGASSGENETVGPNQGKNTHHLAASPIPEKKDRD